jgi:hypothetical protein
MPLKGATGGDDIGKRDSSASMAITRGRISAPLRINLLDCLDDPVSAPLRAHGDSVDARVLHRKEFQEIGEGRGLIRLQDL